jgi:hypothetical protein
MQWPRGEDLALEQGCGSMIFSSWAIPITIAKKISSPTLHPMILNVSHAILIRMTISMIFFSDVVTAQKDSSKWFIW